jgi:hypothetical protein
MDEVAVEGRTQRGFATPASAIQTSARVQLGQVVQRAFLVAAIGAVIPDSTGGKYEGTGEFPFATPHLLILVKRSPYRKPIMKLLRPSLLQSSRVHSRQTLLLQIYECSQSTMGARAR